MLEVSDLRVNYGAVSAIRGVSLSVAAGEVVALLGA
ncbi:MAG: branched-chain amino acid ABC transporter ATP-binding protein, partial [Dongia sp.]